MPEWVVIVFLVLFMLVVLCFGAFAVVLPFLCADWDFSHLFGATDVTGRFLRDGFSGLQAATMRFLELKGLRQCHGRSPDDH